MEERGYFYSQYSIQFCSKQLKCDTLSGLNVFFLFLWECLFAFFSSLYILARCVFLMVQMNYLCMQIVYLTFRVRSVHKTIGAIGFANKHVNFKAICWSLGDTKQIILQMRQFSKIIWRNLQSIPKLVGKICNTHCSHWGNYEYLLKTSNIVYNLILWFWEIHQNSQYCTLLLLLLFCLAAICSLRVFRQYLTWRQTHRDYEHVQ